MKRFRRSGPNMTKSITTAVMATTVSQDVLFSLSVVSVLEKAKRTTRQITAATAATFIGFCISPFQSMAFDVGLDLAKTGAGEPTVDTDAGLPSKRVRLGSIVFEFLD